MDKHFSNYQKSSISQAENTWTTLETSQNTLANTGKVVKATPNHEKIYMTKNLFLLFFLTHLSSLAIQFLRQKKVKE